MAKKQAEYKACPVCKIQFRLSRAWKKWCSERCAKKAKRNREKTVASVIQVPSVRETPFAAVRSHNDGQNAYFRAVPEGYVAAPETATVDLAMKRLDPERMSFGRWEYEYEVRLGDELIVINRDPECSACRALLAKGITGTARFMRRGAPYMTMNIERAAQYRVRETERHGPRFVKYQPFPSEIVRALQEACRAGRDSTSTGRSRPSG
jgi:hypothetical protein